MIVNGGPPVVVYAGPGAVRREEELVALGAFGVAHRREHLLELVHAALGRQAPATS